MQCFSLQLLASQPEVGFCWAAPADAGLDNTLRLRTAPAALRGTSAVEVLFGVHERAGAALKPPADPAKGLAPPIAAVLGRLQSRAVVRAAEVVVAGAGDEDDLFYESGGAATQQLLAALVCPTFLLAALIFVCTILCALRLHSICFASTQSGVACSDTIDVQGATILEVSSMTYTILYSRAC